MFNLKILYVEDDAQSRKGYMVVLKDYFKEVIEAENGKEALALYYAEKPDIVLTDINMPLLDGLELITAIREEDKKTAVIVLSAYADSEKLLKAIPLGLFAYLIKPIKSRELAVTLENVGKMLTENSIMDIVNGYSLNSLNYTLCQGSECIALTKAEYKFLILLMENGSEVVSYEKISHVLWEEYNLNSTPRLQNLVTRLRRKAPELIDGVYGFGYKIKE